MYIPHFNEEFNYSKAGVYGTIEYGFTFDFSGDPTIDVKVKERVRSFMAPFDAETDYILISGSPIMCMYALACAVESNDHPVSVLRFDRDSRGYKEVVFDV